MEFRHRLFLGITIFILAAGFFLNPYLDIYLVKQGMSGKELKTAQRADSEMENQFLWFSYKDEQMILNCHKLMMEIPETIQYLDTDGAVHTVSSENMIFDDTMSGTYFAMAEPVELDFNGDGQSDTIYMTAKTDANETQGFAEYSRVLGEKTIPIELIMNGKTGLLVLQNGEPYTGTLQMTSTRGLNMEVECTGEEIPVDVRDLRSGLLVKIENEKNEIYLGSYIAQEHTIFTLAHAKVMTNIALMAALTAIGIFAVCVSRRVSRNGSE